MNNVLQSVVGVVEGVGDKFNGSLKVNGQWYSNKKGFKNPAVKGDNVTLSLDPWEFQGKTGLSIVGVTVNQGTPVERPTVEDLQKENKEADLSQQNLTNMIPANVMQFPGKTLSSGRDFDAENRGKVRHGLLVPLMPLIASETITAGVARELVRELTEFVMTGK